VDDKDQDAWEEQLKASDRPKELTNMMIALVHDVSSLYGPASGHRVVGFVTIPQGSGVAIAEKMVEGLFNRLNRAKTRAYKLIDEKSTRLASALAAYVKDKTGYAGDLRTELARRDFLNRVDRYLDKGINDLHPSASSLVRAWIDSKNDIQSLRDSVRPLVDRAQYQAATVVRSELQNAYIQLCREGFSAAKSVKRVVQPGACGICRSRAGVQSNTVDAFWSHPNCACTFESVDTQESVDQPALPAFSALQEVLRCHIS
jgi:hypothetical protein